METSPTNAGLKNARPMLSRFNLSQLFGTYGLLIIAVLFAIFFSILLPRTFPTALTVRAILNDRAPIALLSLSALIVIAIGEFDLSLGYLVGLTHILAVGLQTRQDVPWLATVLLVLGIGALIGLINGLLVHVAKISSFIATLGVGTTVYGLSQWYTEGRQIVGALAPAFVEINGASLLGLPAPTLYVIAIAIGLWLVFEFLPIGRYMYALGSNARAAELVGIPRGQYTIAAFVASGTLTAFAGLLIASRFQVGQANIGPEYLLPSFVGALLGATTVKPGRVNIWGTLIAVMVLAIGISGIQQLGGAFYVEPLFNGLTLIIAVGLAGYAARRRLHSKTTQ
jgi:ribose transport system permease protein